MSVDLAANDGTWKSTRRKRPYTDLLPRAKGKIEERISITNHGI